MENNISSAINLVMKIARRTVKDIETGKFTSLSEIEILRWVYIKLGDLFCYDYRIMNDISVKDKRYEYDSEKEMFLYVDKYETCLQISEILAIVINNLNLNAKAYVVPRRKEVIQGAYMADYDVDHMATVVEMNDELNTKYLFDLTLDLFLIQSECKTMDFGYATDCLGTYDIIPQRDLEKIDKKLNLIRNNGYRDLEFERVKDELDKFNGLEHSLEMKVDWIIKSFDISFDGTHEGKRFVSKCFNELLSPRELQCFKEYNIACNSKGAPRLITCFIFEVEGELLCYLYNNKLGLLPYSAEDILDLFNLDFETNSKTLISLLEKYVGEKNRKLTN